MRPENLKAPAGSPPWMNSFVQSLRQTLQTLSGGGEPKQMYVVADIASAPPVDQWQGCVCVAEDGDGLGNPKLIYSDGTNWSAL